MNNDFSDNDVMQGTITRDLPRVAYFYSEFEIIYMSFIAENLILYIDIRKMFRVVYTGKFLPGKYEKNSNYLTLEKECKKAIVNEEVVASDLSY